MSVHNTQYRLSLLGFALLTITSVSQAQLITITKRQSSLGRELSNPFPVAEDVISSNDVTQALGNNPMPSRFSRFELDVTMFVSERDTSGNMLGTGGIASFNVQLSNAPNDNHPMRPDPFDPNNRIAFNFSFSDSGEDYGTDSQSTDVVVQPGDPLHMTSAAFVPVTFSGDISDVQSDDLIRALTVGYGSDPSGNPIKGFRPFIGGNGQSRYYRYEPSASYTLRLFTTNPVPEPGTVALLGSAALVGSGMVLRRRRR